MHPKNFLVKIYAYQYATEFVIESLDGPLDIENSIVDRLGKGDIKWEYLGEMNDPKVKRITYEEVINDANTSNRTIYEEKSSGPRMGAGAS